MPTNREIYFGLLKLNSKYINSAVAKEAVLFANGFHDDYEFLSHMDDECKDPGWVKANTEKLLSGMPIQYVTGTAYFSNLRLTVNENVLIPRQETEELVRLVAPKIQRLAEKGPVTILDVCTGSGAIALALKQALPSSNVYGSDISCGALHIAKQNSRLTGLPITLLKGDLLDPFIKEGIAADVVVSNPPYIESSSTIDEQVWRYEPHLALMASPDTYFYEKIIAKSTLILQKPHILAFEIGEEMKEKLLEIGNRYYANDNITFANDMYGKCRFMFIESGKKNE